MPECRRNGFGGSFGNWKPERAKPRVF